MLRSARDFLVVVDHAEIVRHLKPDIASLSKIDMGIGGAIVTGRGDNEADYVCRFFPPSVGIAEDPAIGSIQCILVPFWAGRTGKQAFRVAQWSPRGGKELYVAMRDLFLASLYGRKNAACCETAELVT